MELVHHHGYGLQFEPFGRGCRISIFPPGEIWPLTNSPASNDPTKTDELIAKAEAIVEAHCIRACPLTSASDVFPPL